MIMMRPITATRIEIAAMAKKLDDLPILGVEITSAFAMTGKATAITNTLTACAIFWAEPKSLIR